MTGNISKDSIMLGAGFFLGRKQTFWGRKRVPLARFNQQTNLRLDIYIYIYMVPATQATVMDHVLWARATEHPSQILVFTKTAGHHDLVEVVVI